MLSYDLILVDIVSFADDFCVLFSFLFAYGGILFCLISVIILIVASCSYNFGFLTNIYIEPLIYPFMYFIN